MSNNSALRQFLIIQKLQQTGGCSFADLQKYIEANTAGNADVYIERTFFRDKIAIRSAHIEIDYDRKNKIHKIITPDDELNARLIEFFGMFNLLMQQENFSKYIFFENRRQQGLQHFQTLLDAIKQHYLVGFKHQKFYEDNVTTRLVEPYALKEFKGRWYLLAKEQAGNTLKTFGLDRMTQVVAKRKKFIYPSDANPAHIFENCFGIITPSANDELQEVILSFTTEQGKYIKSYKLHTSQQELTAGNDEYKISLRIYITYDFIMEILSHGEDVEVIAPACLKEEVIKRHTAALTQY